MSDETGGSRATVVSGEPGSGPDSGAGRFLGVGGLQLFWQRWCPAGEPRAVLAFVHGVGEHSGRYGNLVGPLVAAGYAVYGYDQRGHGRSPGPRVHVERWTEYRDDLHTFLGLVGSRELGRPLVLYGHSMGSLVVLDELIEHPGGVDGAIVSGVALQPAGVGKPYQRVLVRVLSRVAPRLSLDLKIAGDDLTRDPAALVAGRADPHLTSRATVRWGAESLAAVARIEAGMAAIEVPLLVLHGGADPLNRPAGAHALVDAAPGADTTLHVYPGVRHEPHNDLGHERVAADIIDWLAGLGA